MYHLFKNLFGHPTADNNTLIFFCVATEWTKSVLRTAKSMIKDQELNDKRKYRNSPEKEGKWNGPRASDSGSTNAKQPMKNQQRAAKKHWPATKYYAIYMKFTYLEQGHCSLIYANPQEISFCGFKVDKSVLQPVRLMMSLGRLTKKKPSTKTGQEVLPLSLCMCMCVCVLTHRFTPTPAHIFLYGTIPNAACEFSCPENSILLDRAPFPLFYALLRNILFLCHFYFLLVCHCWVIFVLGCGVAPPPTLHGHCAHTASSLTHSTP